MAGPCYHSANRVCGNYLRKRWNGEQFELAPTKRLVKKNPQEEPVLRKGKKNRSCEHHPGHCPTKIEKKGAIEPEKARDKVPNKRKEGDEGKKGKAMDAGGTPHPFQNPLKGTEKNFGGGC